MKQKHLTETPVCPQEHLLIISNTTGLSFALERIGPLAAIIIIVFYSLVLYLLALSNTSENPFASIYSESLIKTACQHLLLLVGFDTYLSKVLRYTPYTCGSSALMLLSLVSTTLEFLSHNSGKAYALLCHVKSRMCVLPFFRLLLVAMVLRWFLPLCFSLIRFFQNPLHLCYLGFI
jgi:hypothetical protein